MRAEVQGRWARPSSGVLLPIKIIRLLPTWVAQNPATAKVADTDRWVLVAGTLLLERGAADKLGDTGQTRRSQRRAALHAHLG